MAIQPINIVVKDSIDGGVGQKLLEIARNARQAEADLTDLRLAVTSLSASELKAATAAERLNTAKHNTATAAARAEAAKLRLERATRTVTTSEEKLGTMLRQAASAKLAVQRAEQGLATERLRLQQMTDRGVRSETALALQHERLEAATERLAGETLRLEAADERLAAEQDRVGAAVARTTGHMTGQATAISTLDAGMNQHNQRLAASRQNTSLAAHHAQNLAFQFQDIGVSLASGQPAWRVFMQQGAQIQGIMAQAGLSVKGLGTQLLRFAAPFLPWVAAAGAAYLAVDTLTNSLNNFLGLVDPLGDELRGATGALGELDNQMITMGDTIGGLGRMFMDLWSVHVMPTVGSIWDGVTGVFTQIVSVVQDAVNLLIGHWVGLYNAFSSTFRTFPAVMGDMMYSAANGVIGGIEYLLNSSIGLINDFMAGANNLFAPLRGLFAEVGVEIGEFGEVGEVSLGRLENAYEGTAAATASMIREQYLAAQGVDYVGEAITFATVAYEDFIETLSEYALESRNARLSEEERVRVTERASELYEQIRRPVTEYTESLSALEVMLRRGIITQREFNAALAGLELPSGMRELEIELQVAGGDQFADQRARVEEQLQERLLLLEQYQRATEMSDEEHQRRRNEIEADAARQRMEIDQEEQRMRLAGMAAAAGDLSTILAGALGEQSEAARTMFAISKAFAIAESVVAIQQSIAKAMSIGWPQNIPLIAQAASQGAQIISTLKATQPAFADGGYVSGPGGPRDDQIQARLSNGEFVINASATAEHRGLLEAINSGASRSQIARQTPAYANGGLVGSRTSNIDRSVSTTTTSGTSISFGNISISGSDMSEDEVKRAMAEVVDQKMRTDYAPKILAVSRQQANDDMTQRFQRKTI